MVSIFTENLWLANPTTLIWYSELSRFVDLWHRWLDESIPVEVIEEMNHTEERLYPFYKELEDQIVILKLELTGKSVKDNKNDIKKTFCSKNDFGSK